MLYKIFTAGVQKQMQLNLHKFQIMGSLSNILGFGLEILLVSAEVSLPTLCYLLVLTPLLESLFINYMLLD